MKARLSKLGGTPTRRGRFGFWLRTGLAGLGTVSAAGGFVLAVTGHPVETHVNTHSAIAPPMAPAAAPLNHYWMVAADGGVFSFGGAPFYGSTGAIHLNKPIVGMAPTPTGNGYWFVASDGGVFNFGDAGFYGSTGALHLNQPVVGMAPTPSGHGYWLVAADGGIFNFGDAGFYGSTGAIHLNKPIVGMASSPSGHGYWFVASDGGIFNYGDAGFYGSAGALHLNQPVVGMARTPDGGGYWMVASDGGIFNYGDAGFYGSTGAIHLNQPIVGMAPSPTGHGYWFVASDGGIFNYGDAGFAGSMGATKLNQPVVGMAGQPTLFGATAVLNLSASNIAADGVSQVTAVTRVTDPSGTPVPGDTLNFTVTGAGCGTVSPSHATTDMNGIAVFNYTASNTVATCAVRAVEAFGSAQAAHSISQSAGAPAVMVATPGPSTYTADDVIPATFTVLDGQGHPVANVPLDVAHNVPNGNLDVLGGSTDSSGSLTVHLTDVVAGSVGKVTAYVHGTSVHSATGTITITAGKFASLSSPTVVSQTAGHAYAVSVNATDAHGNSVNPDPSTFTFGGSALQIAPDNNAAHTGAAAVRTPGFAGGAATIDVTSYFAGSGLQLTITSGLVQTATQAYTVGPDAVAGVTTVTPSSPTTVSADAGATGIAIGFLTTDGYGNSVGGVQLDFTQGGGLGNAVLPAPATSSTTAGPALGVASTSFTDTKATDAGKVTATVHGTPSIHADTPTITIVSGVLDALALTTPATQQAGTQYTSTLTATDHYGNPVNPPSNAVSFGGTALANAPDGNHPGSAALAGPFSGGHATVNVTSYNATQNNPTAKLSATDGVITTSTNGYKVNAGQYMQLVASSASFVASDLGANTLFFQDPTGTPTATITLTAKDGYGNTVSTNADAVTMTLAPENLVSGEKADSGTLKSGATTTAPDTAGQVTLATSLNGGTVDITYTAPTGITVPEAGIGKITFADTSAVGSPPAYSPSAMYATVTKVHTVSVGVASTSFTADTGKTPGVDATTFATDGVGNDLGSVPVDLTTTLPGSPTFNPVNPLLTKSAVPGPPGAATAKLHATTVGTGTVTAVLRGAPLSSVNLSSTTPTIHVSVGVFAVLTLSAPAPSIPTAGVPYTATLTSTDAEGNPLMPTGTLSKNGSALDAAPNASHTGTATPGATNPATGQATVNGTAYKAESATLSITYGTVTSNTVTFTVNNAAPATVTAAVPSCCDADTGNTGVTLTVTAVDQFGNPVPAQNLKLTSTLAHATIDVSASPAKSNSVAFPVTVVTDNTGTATAKVYDTQAASGHGATPADTGTITATVPLTTVHGDTAGVTITPGAVTHVSLTNPGDQTAGVAYNVTASVTDAFANDVNPPTTQMCWGSSMTVTCSGKALDLAPDGNMSGSAFFSGANPFTGGQATLTVTSYKAEGGVALTVTTGGVSGSTTTYKVNAAAASHFLVTSGSAHYNAGTHTLSPTADGESATFNITIVDTWQNVASDHQADVIHVVLTADTPPDGGSLTGGGHTTGSDTAAPVPVDVTLSGGTGSFLYTASTPRVAATKGSIAMTDTTAAGITSVPGAGIIIQN